jgi:glycosyltransferase involved in cell wall biosynthesis
MKASPRPRVLLLQHAIYPYRRPLFEELNRSLELTVLFCVHAKAFRQWDTSGMLDDPPFRARVLPHLRLGPLVFNRGLVREMRAGRFDAIVLGVIDLITLPQVMTVLIASRALRIPVIVCEEFFPTDWYVQSRPLVARLALATRKFVYRRTDAFATWNLKAREFLVGCGVDASRVFSGPHSYPTPDALGAALQHPPEFVTISYFLPRKGLDVLIRAFRRVQAPATLVLAGSGEHEPVLRALAGDDRRIRFAGHLDEAEKTELLAGAYALILPSLWDPWGLVVNEALARGVPAVVTDAAGVSASLNGAGVVVPAGDEDALASALAHLIENPMLRGRLAAEAPGVVAAWTLAAQSEPLIRAIADALERRDRRQTPSWLGNETT